MTKNDIFKKLQKDFNESETERLRTNPIDNVRTMSKADKIIVNNDMFTYLKDDFFETYEGSSIPKVFSKALIEWKCPIGLFRLYVTFPEDRPEYVYIDVFYLWDYWGKIIFPNINQDDYIDEETKKFHHATRIETTARAYSKYNPKVVDSYMVAANSVFMFAYTYVFANKDVKEIYSEDTVYQDDEMLECKTKTTEYRKKKNNVKRDKVFVPRKRRIYTVKKTQVTENNLREYIYSRWKVRGYTYTRKDGKVINVKEHFKHRHLPNQGIEKEGKDYILRKRDEDV